VLISIKNDDIAANRVDNITMEKNNFSCTVSLHNMAIVGQT